MKLRILRVIMAVFIATVSVKTDHSQAAFFALRSRAFIERPAKIPTWVHKSLWRRFFPYNMGKAPRMIMLSGDASEVFDALGKRLRAIPASEEVPGYPGLGNEPFVAVELNVTYPGRTEYRVVIDRVGLLQRRLSQIVYHDIDREDFEFVLYLSAHDERRLIYLHTISIGRELEEDLRGRGYGSKTFAKTVDILRSRYPHWDIATVAAAGQTEHWFGQYFAAHMASFPEYQELNQYVHIPVEDSTSLVIGNVTPQNTAGKLEDALMSMI